MELTEIAKSKINLSLNLNGIKNDGYHDLISFICFGSFSDQLRLKPSKSFSYEINSSMKDITFKDDLVLKVIHKIKKTYDLEDLPKIDLILEKNIPLGSGLGGGSADAAATIRLMNKFLDLGMNQDEMCSFGVDLGTDIPACIISKPLVAYGAGERIVKVDFEKKYQMLIVYPNIEISTKEVFKLVKPVKSKILDLNKTKKTIQENKTINYRKLLFEKGVSKISVIGVGMITTPGVTYRMFQTLANKRINIQVISTSEIKISVLIDKNNTKRALTALHKEFKLDNKK